MGKSKVNQRKQSGDVRRHVQVIQCASLKIHPRTSKARQVDVRDIHMNHPSNKLLAYLAQSNVAFGVYKAGETIRTFYFNRPGDGKLRHKELKLQFMSEDTGRALKIPWRIKVAVYDRDTDTYTFFSANEKKIAACNAPVSDSQLTYFNIPR